MIKSKPSECGVCHAFTMEQISLQAVKFPLLAKIMICVLAADKILLYHYSQFKNTILHTCQLFRYQERLKDGKWRH
jgi:hypothetical protein